MMKLSFVETTISFLLGVLWALLALTLLSIFLAVRPFFDALFFALLDLLFWLFWMVILWVAAIQVEKLKELQKQTKLLEKIASK